MVRSPNPRVLVLLGCFAVLSFVRTVGWAQISLDIRSQTPARAAVGTAHIRIDQNLVLLPVSVSDRFEHPITGLAKDHFHVFDNNVEQTITHFAMEDAPLAAGLVFDTSASMGRKLRRSRLSVNAFFRTANTQDEFLLVTFNNRPRVAVPLTTDTGVIENRLAAEKPKGATALLDAIYLAVGELKKSDKSRKALLIISDGGDNNSRYSASEIKHLVRESNILIYGIGIYESLDSRGRTPEEFHGSTLLSEIAELTGGREFAVDRLQDLPDAAAKIGRELRNYYVLGFSPGDSLRDGKYHRIQVKLTPPRGMTRLQARWRQGYYAPTE
jgi:Ca-activated chloride channel homolog